jgi:hypothetical protein
MTNLSETPMPEQNPAKPPMSPRAKRYWGSLIAAVLLGVLIDVVFLPQLHIVEITENSTGQATQGEIFGAFLSSHIGPGSGLLLALLWGIGLPAVAMFHMRNVDEQEMNAKLWGGLLSSYAVLIGIPVWHILWMASFAPPVDIWAIFLLVMIVKAAAFIWLKFRP